MTYISIFRRIFVATPFFLALIALLPLHNVINANNLDERVEAIEYHILTGEANPEQYIPQNLDCPTLKKLNNQLKLDEERLKEEGWTNSPKANKKLELLRSYQQGPRGLAKTSAVALLACITGCSLLAINQVYELITQLIAVGTPRLTKGFHSLLKKGTLISGVLFIGSLMGAITQQIRHNKEVQKKAKPIAKRVKRAIRKMGIRTTAAVT